MNDSVERSAARAELVARARATLAEIQQIFNDVAHWNRVHVPWKGKPIDPDPDGHLKHIAEGLHRILEKEADQPTVDGG